MGGGGGGEGRMLISFQVRLLEKFTRHVNESFRGNHEVFTSLEKTIMGHVYFRRQITPQAGS